MSGVKSQFQRTICDCNGCSSHCRIKPGFLIPSDIQAIEEFCEHRIDETPVFRLSSKTRVMIGNIVMPLITITPNVKDDGSCIFLNDEGKCDIHPVSPFGCSHFDGHMSFVESEKRLRAGVNEVLHDLMNYGPYCERVANMELDCHPVVEIRFVNQ